MLKMQIKILVGIVLSLYGMHSIGMMSPEEAVISHCDIGPRLCVELIQNEELLVGGKIKNILSLVCINKASNNWLNEHANVFVDVLQNKYKLSTQVAAEVLNFNMMTQNIGRLFDIAESKDKVFDDNDLADQFFVNATGTGQLTLLGAVVSKCIDNDYNPCCGKKLNQLLGSKKISTKKLIRQISDLMVFRHWDSTNAEKNSRLLSTMQLLINAADNIDYREFIVFYTLLMDAVRKGDDTVAYLLLRKGANPYLGKLDMLGEAEEEDQYIRDKSTPKHLSKEVSTDHEFRINSFQMSCWTTSKRPEGWLEDLVEFVKKE